MDDYLKRLAESCEAAGLDHMVLGNTLWWFYQRMVMPFGPACQDFRIAPSDEETLLRRFPKAILVRYTDGFQVGGDAADGSATEPLDRSWYAVVCDRFAGLDEVTSHLRNQLRRGLRLCTVSKVDAEYIAQHGYDCYLAAFDRYRNIARPDVSRAGYARNILEIKDYQDLWQYWAVCVGDEVAGYALALAYGDIEANYATMKFDPRFLKAYSSYALHFKMNEYYLRDRGVAMVCNGFRSIGHDTRIQDHLITKFGFRCVATHLYVRYRPWVRAALCLPRFAKRIIGRFVPHYNSLCKLDQARTRP